MACETGLQGLQMHSRLNPRCGGVHPIVLMGSHCERVYWTGRAIIKASINA
jgi:hypothetical protein